MSRPVIPFVATDISALARSLRERLSQSPHPPTHVEMLNILARAAGYRNFQSLRAKAATVPQQPVDTARLQRLARYFDPQGRLATWPAKSSLQSTCLWILWSKLPPHETLSEVALNKHLIAAHLFGDHALLRRELCDQGLISRTPDGREYRRIERRPPAEAIELIRHLDRSAQ